MNDNLNMNEEVKVPESVNPTLNKKRKWKFLIGGLIFVIALAIGLFIGYNKLNSNPYVIYKDTINDIYKSLNKVLDESKKEALNIDVLNEPINIRAQAKLNSDMEELKLLNNLNYELQLGMDYKNKKGAVNLGISDDDSPIVKLLLTLANKKLLLKSEELFDKTIDFGEADVFKSINLDEISNVSYDAKTIDTILVKEKNIIIDSLDKDKFKLENTKIKLDNKEQKVKKVTYVLDKENMERTLKYIVRETKKDEELLEALGKILGISGDEVKDKLDTVLDNKEYVDFNIILYVNMLNDVVAAELEKDGEILIKYENVHDLFKLNIGGEEATDGMLEITEEKEDILVKLQDGTEKLELKIGKDEDNKNINFDIDVEGLVANGYLKLSNQKYSKAKYSGNFEFKVEGKADKQDFDLKLTGSISIDSNKLPEIDDKNTVYYEDLSESDMAKIYNNLINIAKKFNLTDLFV